MRMDLKIEIVRSGLKNYEIAREMGWPPGKITRVLNGTYDPSKAEREAIAGILGVCVYDIFPERIIMPPSEYTPSPEAA